MDAMAGIVNHSIAHQPMTKERNLLRYIFKINLKVKFVIVSYGISSIDKGDSKCTKEKKA